MKLETLAIHGGLEEYKETGDVVPPIHKSTVFRHSRQEEKGKFNYTRAGNPNRTQLERQLASLEKGKECAAFSSGVAATAAVFQSLDPNDHIIGPLDVYHGTRSLLTDVMGRWGLKMDFVDMTNTREVEQAITSDTRLIWVETPSNPMLHITDISSIVRISRERDIVVCVDNTWPTPVNQRPLDWGADLVLHSTTKYLGGHSDLLGGAVIGGNDGGMFERIRELQMKAGAVPSPDDCWLLTRSIRTLPYRVRAQNRNAAEIAELLDGHSAVEQVCYPGLSSHEEHKLADEQMEGYGGMMSFLVKGDESTAKNVTHQTKLITPATSLGGVESTWEHRKSSEGEESETPGNLIRLSVGLEHPEDLKSDIRNALDIISS